MNCLLELSFMGSARRKALQFPSQLGEEQARMGRVVRPYHVSRPPDLPRLALDVAESRRDSPRKEPGGSGRTERAAEVNSPSPPPPTHQPGK